MCLIELLGLKVELIKARSFFSTFELLPLHISISNLLSDMSFLALCVTSQELGVLIDN